MEETNEAEGMRAEREAGGSDELQSRIQELEGHLEDLQHDNMALRNKLKVVHEEKTYLQEDAATLKEKLLSQVKLEVWSVWCIAYVGTKYACLIAGGSSSES